MTTAKLIEILKAADPSKSVYFEDDGDYFCEITHIRLLSDGSVGIGGGYTGIENFYAEGNGNKGVVLLGHDWPPDKQ